MTEDKAIPRDRPDPDPARAARVKETIQEIKDARAYWEKKHFKRWLKNQKYAKGLQNGKENLDDSPYVVNITFSHLQKRKSALYAKNPTVVVKPRKKLYLMTWDGSAESYLQAAQAVSTGMGDPMSMEIIMEAQMEKERISMMKKVAKAVELVYRYQIKEPQPKWKPQMKQAVMRVLTNGVAYCKMGYQRFFEPRASMESEVKDWTARMAELERLAADAADGEFTEGAAEMDELKTKLQNAQKEPALLREGLAFSFPKSTAIIIDPDCYQLKGFLGARWVAEYVGSHTPKQVMEKWKVDVSTSPMTQEKSSKRAKNGKKNETVDVYLYYDLVGQEYSVLCDGYPDYLEEPGDPPVKLEQFHPYFPLTFNDVEDEEDIFPPSNVDLIRDMNDEMNRSRQALKEHRMANRPAYLGVNNPLEKEDVDRLSNHKSSEYIPLKLPSGVSAKDAIVAKPTIPIQPEIYETDSLFADAQRVSGDQEANLGGTSDATATEASIAENSRLSSLESNKDDLDEFLADVASAGVQILLREMNKETVARIAGPAAAQVWPEYSNEEIFADLDVDLVAGSSGRPNRGIQISNMERVTPLLLQVPGVRPDPLARRLVSLLDEDIDVDEFVAEGLPSILAANRAMGGPPGAPVSNTPEAQGGQGGDNAEGAPERGDTVGTPADPAPVPGDMPAESQYG